MNLTNGYVKRRYGVLKDYNNAIFGTIPGTEPNLENIFQPLHIKIIESS